ncbi:hypothetical protein AGABI2DRAFT_134575 [Agaricus bisporus var. bisporus H97]|uniref:hypothetical protein n=1 Tax=Agaricus bisporus var. bisporus (strain H97 / ATCC MYA-4626 / FGSC 10389) TaxID=936046 RepID=UPI00029F4F57|nr:hypothetical protein AGABI2DRAFT_134575 [Agaricus bisporus var. bisporus H97]EKV48950.1 hypothetical protein AGABI2DRAFT_134575 [Agaricus bisporus var. bisporus H97]
MPRGTANEYREKKRLEIRDLRRKYQTPSSSRRGTPALSRATPVPEHAMLTRSSGSKTLPNISRSTRPALRSSTATLVDRSSLAQAKTYSLPASLQTHVEEVADFLRTCNPDMTYFLPAFIDFGCRSQSYLEALASYSDEHMDDIFMRMASKALPEVVLTEMDIWVLKQGLKEFVDTTKSDAKKKRKSC